MTANSTDLPGWMIAWLNSEEIRRIENQNPVLWNHILLACRQMAWLEVLFHDLYKTLAGVREPDHEFCCNNPKEPIEDVRALLGISDDRRHEFKNICLTTPHQDPRRFLEAVIARSEADRPVTPEIVGEMEHRLDIEQQLLYVFQEVLLILARLKQAYRQGMITDSMPFAPPKLLTKSGLNNVLEEALVIVSSLMQICKGSGDGTELYRKAAEAAGYLAEPFRKLGMFGDNLFRDILPALLLGFVAILIDRDYEYMDRYGNWRKLVRAEGLFNPIVSVGDVMAYTGPAKLEDLNLRAMWTARSGLTDLPRCLPEHSKLELKDWQVCFADETGGFQTMRLGDLDTEQVWKLGISFGDLLVPVTDDEGLDKMVRLGDVPLRYLLRKGSKLLVPYGEYLPERTIRLRDESGNMQSVCVGDLTLERAWKLGISYGDLVVDTFDDEGRPQQVRLVDLALAVLRSYEHVPAPLPGE